MKKILSVLIFFGLLGVGFGMYLYNKPLESTEKMETDYFVQASELLTAFEENEPIANDKFLDKVLEVKGKVIKIDKKEGKTVIYQETDNPMSNVIIQLEKPESEIETGEVITLKGICTGYLMDVVMVRGIQI